VFKIDLHTHSIASPDGALRTQNYRTALEMGTLDYVAVTDHNTVDFARQLHKELGDNIIVGEEITAQEGELIGLFLCEVIPAGLSAGDTIAAIHAQRGLVYIPHPFETVRKGLPLAVLNAIAADVDIIETYNGRAVFQNRGAATEQWAKAHHTPGAASSDAHGRAGWGRTYSIVDEPPTRENLIKLLEGATYQKGSVGARGVLYPKLNRMRKRFKRA
jgi:predicted metal-dependent phosphoesterase TrpH